MIGRFVAYQVDGSSTTLGVMAQSLAETLEADGSDTDATGAVLRSFVQSVLENAPSSVHR